MTDLHDTWKREQAERKAALIRRAEALHLALGHNEWILELDREEEDPWAFRLERHDGLRLGCYCRGRLEVHPDLKRDRFGQARPHHYFLPRDQGRINATIAATRLDTPEGARKVAREIIRRVVEPWAPFLVEVAKREAEQAAKFDRRQAAWALIKGKVACDMHRETIEEKIAKGETFYVRAGDTRLEVREYGQVYVPHFGVELDDLPHLVDFLVAMQARRQAGAG